MRSSSSYLNFVAFTPTDTWSIVPSAAITSASLPRLVALIRAANSMASGVSTRSVTTPMGWLASWYINSRGALPSTGRLPGINMISLPSDTVANTLYGTATPLMVRLPSPSAAALSTLNSPAISLIMLLPLRDALLCVFYFGLVGFVGCVVFG